MKNENYQNKFIVVIDDDPIMRISCQRILEKHGFEIETFENGEDGIARIRERHPDLLIVDLKMPKIGGLEVIGEVHQIDADVAIVVITGYATIGTAVNAIKAGAYDFLPKPFTPDELRLIVFRSLERSDLVRKTRMLENEKKKMEHRFISFVAHQLQSPLVAVQQYLDVLLHLDDSRTRNKCYKEWIERSLKRIKEMQTLVTDWLTLSKIESGHLVENITTVAIPPLVQEILDCFGSCLAERNIEITTELPEDLAPVTANAECLRMIFMNLVSNAIKYNRQNGTIKIHSQENTHEIRVSVADTGIGIPEEQLPHIFDEFHRVKTESTRNIPGSGLGLAICKKIVAELGGDIQLVSTLNLGTTVTVILPKCR
jgi:signal transduction histidine kinase